MIDIDHKEPPCIHPGCSAERVSGSRYCDDHELQQQVAASTRPRPTGTLATLIRGAKEKGLIAPVATGYVSGS